MGLMCWVVRGGEVMFFNTTRSHAMVIGQVLHSAQLCWPNDGLLFFEITPLPQHIVRALSPAGPPRYLVHCDEHGHCTSGKHLDECLDFGTRECFSRYTTALLT